MPEKRFDDSYIIKLNGIAQESIKYDTVGTFDIHPVGIAGNVIGNSMAAAIYQDYYIHQGEYYTERFDIEKQLLVFVDPNLVEGIHVRGVPPERKMKHVSHQAQNPTFSIEKPEIFWTMHGQETHERYLELTSYIPVINGMLYGHSEEKKDQIIEQLRNDPILGACASLCFSKEHRIKVWELGGIYEFDGDGRHRIISARENMMKAQKAAEANKQTFSPYLYNIPVQIIGTIRRDQ